MKTVLMPLPDQDFDTTEVAVPWRLLTRAGHRVLFAGQSGQTPATDPLLLSGVIFGQLGAAPEARAFYGEMVTDPAFQRPARWEEVDADAVDALWLPGGHARGMRPYLESPVVQELARRVWARRLPVAAICHGVLVAARAGLLQGVRSTCLPRYMERSAWLLTAWKLGDYYRTYPTWVEDEVIAAGARFERGPISLVARGTMDDDRPAFAVEDGPYLSARWPGDAYLLSRRLLARL